MDRSNENDVCVVASGACGFHLHQALFVIAKESN